MNGISSLDGILDAQQPVYNAVYPPVDTSRDQIRLMRLHPSIAFEDPIRIDIFTQDLSNPIEYDALSYVWGSAVSESTATVNGTAMVLTKNLDEALRHIRRPETARVLWIDAVCINQRVTEERNHQVQMMGQIYSSALRVVIWLGSEAGGSAAVISAIRAGADPQQLISTLRFRFELRALCSRPWFSRIWVVQEVALAKQDPIVTCGKTELLWSTFIGFLLQVQCTLEDELKLPSYPYSKFENHWERLVDDAVEDYDQTGLKPELNAPEIELIRINYKQSIASIKSTISDTGSSASSFKVGFGSSGQYAYQIWNSGKTAIRGVTLALRDSILQIMDLERLRRTRPHSHLETQIYRTRKLCSTDTRDKVYALLGVSQFHGPAITPDYSFPIERVFAEAMRTIILHNFEFGYPIFPLRPATVRIHTWPSWVPDLSASQTAHSRYHVDRLCPNVQDIKGLIARVKSRIPLAQFSPDLKVMTTIGVDLGTIVFVDDLSFTDWHDVPHELGRIRRALRDHDISTRVACDAFMVQNDQYRNLCEQEKRKASTDFSKLWGLVSGPVFEYSQSEDFQWICEMVAHGLTNDRTVFVTDSGKVGMSPCNGVRKGDKLAGLFSINFPMVLRRIGMPASGQYIMVCVAHVGCHEWRHDLPERDLSLPTLARSLGMKLFTIH